MSLLDSIRGRLAPSLLTAAGVTLVVAGLLSYTDPAEAGPLPTPSPSSQQTAAATPAPSAAAPSPSGDASASPGVPANRLSTRIQIPAMKIDLPIIKQPDARYPSCNVAMYHEAFGPPGDPRG